MDFFSPFLSIDSLRALFLTYGILIPFLLGIAEEIVFFIPSALVFLAMGAVFISSDVSFGPAFVISFGQIAIPAAFGVVIGAGFMYALAYFGGKPAILAFGRYIGVKWSYVENIGRFFGKGYTDEVVLIALRAIPAFPISVVSVFCGLIRIRPVAFFCTTFIGSFIRVVVLSLAGWYVGKEYTALAGRIVPLERAGALVIFALIFFLYLRLRRPGTHLGNSS